MLETEPFVDFVDEPEEPYGGGPDVAEGKTEKDPIDGRIKKRLCRKVGKNRRICKKRVKKQRQVPAFKP